MNCLFAAAFTRDVKKIDKQVRSSVETAIARIRAVPKVADIAHLKKVHGSPGAFRIRVGDYRLGVNIDGDNVTFMRCLHRREIYRFFP